MKSRTFVFAALALAGTLLAAPAAFAGADADKAKDTKQAATPTGDAAHQAMMAEMAKFAMPGKEHEMFKGMAGKWKATVKMWTGAGEPQVSEGTMDNDVELGGRILEGRFKGTFMGNPMEGLSVMGFDNMKKEYWSFWTDDMSTASMMMTGPASTDANTITMKGTSMGPDGKPAEYVATTKIVDANTHVFTMTTKMGDQMMPMMEITYSRNK